MSITPTDFSYPHDWFRCQVQPHLMQKVVLTILSYIYTHTYADFQYNTFISVECKRNIKKHFWHKLMHYSITITPTFVIYYTD